MRLSRYAVSAILLFTATLTAAKPGPADGSWGGGISFGGWYPIRITFVTGSKGLAGTVMPNAYDGPPQPLLHNSVTGSRVHFEWEEEDGLAVFDGKLAGDRLDGEFTQGGRKGVFHLAKVAGNADLTSFKAHEGLYKSGDQVLWIGRASELRKQPSYIDVATGRFGVLYPASKNSYFAGPRAFPPYPPTVKIDFRGNSRGETSGLRFRQAGGSAGDYARLRVYREQEVSFSNGPVRLAGTLITPNTPGPHPAVVFIHGSGNSTRLYFSSLPYLLANRGIASLIFDKRGSGGSTGDRRTATFFDLADDVIAGVNLLRARPDINRERIGVFGHSQGGWIGPLAASRSPAIAFVVTSAGPATSVDQQTFDLIRDNMRRDGMSAADIEAATNYLNLYAAVRDKKAPWPQLQAAYQEAKSKPWGKYIIKAESEEKVVGKVSEVYDPTPVLSHLKTPMLALLGGQDKVVPPSVNAPLMHSLLRQAGNPDYLVKVIPSGDHDFWETAEGKDFLERDRYAPGYLQTVVEWIVQHSRPQNRAGNSALR